MSLNHTAWENIKDDFGWIPSFLVWMGEFVATLGPGLALVVAVFLFYKQRSTDRQQQLRSRRMALYIRYFEALRGGSDSRPTALRNEFFNEKPEKDDLFDELRLIAPDRVVKAALRLTGANLAPFIDGYGELTLQDTRNNEENHMIYFKYKGKIRDCRNALLKEMRRDLFEGSGLDAAITDVEDLDKTITS